MKVAVTDTTEIEETTETGGTTETGERIGIVVADLRAQEVITDAEETKDRDLTTGIGIHKEETTTLEEIDRHIMLIL